MPRTKSPTRYRWVEVTWQDAAHHAGWSTLDEQTHKYAGLATVRSTGYLVSRNARTVLITQSISDAQGTCADGLSIPRSNVIKIRELK